MAKCGVLGRNVLAVGRDLGQADGILNILENRSFDVRVLRATSDKGFMALGVAIQALRVGDCARARTKMHEISNVVGTIWDQTEARSWYRR